MEDHSEFLTEELHKLYEIVSVTHERLTKLESRVEEIATSCGRGGGGGGGQPDAAAAQRLAVEKLASCAAMLEEQLDNDANPENTSPDEVPAVRLARLEGRVEALADEAEALREERRAVAVGTLLEQHAGCPAEGGAARDDSRIEELETEVQGLRRVIEQKLLSEQDTMLAELDRRNESRLTSVWKELKGFTDAATAHTNSIERSLLSRIDKNDKSLVGACAGVNCRFTEANAKQLESMAFRMSLLEWSTNGEKRSFSRPLQASLASSAPSLPALSDDSELWAKEPSGQLRLRRKMQLPRTTQQTPPALLGEHPRQQTLKKNTSTLRHH